jgi:hypothetical protein
MQELKNKKVGVVFSSGFFGFSMIFSLVLRRKTSGILSPGIRLVLLPSPFLRGG